MTFEQEIEKMAEALEPDNRLLFKNGSKATLELLAKGGSEGELISRLREFVAPADIYPATSRILDQAANAIQQSQATIAVLKRSKEEISRDLVWKHEEILELRKDLTRLQKENEELKAHINDGEVMSRGLHESRMAVLEKEIERLNIQLRVARDAQLRTYDGLSCNNERLEARVKELEEVVSFYGDPDNWGGGEEEQGYLWQREFLPTPQDYSNTEGSIMTAGHRARKALTQPNRE